ncbi:MAG: ester cyclase [Chloroflexota bacterium]|nr:ester cyclase [Chloroflexota bacterium]
MSAEDNKALARRFVEAINNKDMSMFDEIIAEDYIQHNPQVAQGREGVKLFFAYFFSAFPDLHLTADDIVAQDDRVATRWTMRATHRGEFFGVPATGRRVVVTGMDLWRIADGKAAEHWDSIDNLGMLQQLGVIPAPDAAPAAATE